MAICEMDPRPGGLIRLVWREPGGAEMGLSGIYRETVRPERIVHKELFDADWTGGDTLVTIVLEERDNKSTVALAVQYSSSAARDTALKYGMQQGLAAWYDCLDEHLASAMAGT